MNQKPEQAGRPELDLDALIAQISNLSAAHAIMTARNTWLEKALAKAEAEMAELQKRVEALVVKE